MKIDKNIPIGTKDSKSLLWNQIVNNLEVGDSTLFKCSSAIESELNRNYLTYQLKKLKLKHKYSFRKWDEENYRVWRTS